MTTPKPRADAPLITDTLPYKECPSAASTTLSLFLPSPSPRQWLWTRKQDECQAPPTAAAASSDLRTDAALVKRVASAITKHFAAADCSGSGSGRDPTRRHHHLHQLPLTEYWCQQHQQHLPTAAIFPYLAGLAAYHLPRDEEDPASTVASLRVAQRLFRTCLSLLPAGVEEVNMASRGLAWTLERTRVVWNVRICGLEAEWEEGKGELVAGEQWGVNGMPGGLCFELVE